MSRSEPLRLPAPFVGARAARAEAPAASASVDAQLLGRAYVRRGLREGGAALRRARAAYLSAEWSGDDDRRPPAGLLVRTRL